MINDKEEGARHALGECEGNEADAERPNRECR